MFSCLQILEAFLWFVLITLLNVTLIILTLSVSRLLNLLLRLVARSEERFSRNAETDLVCRLLLEKKKRSQGRLDRRTARTDRGGARDKGLHDDRAAHAIGGAHRDSTRAS